MRPVPSPDLDKDCDGTPVVVRLGSLMRWIGARELPWPTRSDLAWLRTEEP